MDGLFTRESKLKEIRKALAERGFSGKVAEHEPMARHCSLKVGGPAGLFVVPGDTGELNLLVDVLESGGVSWCVLGGGTNVLFANGGFAGCVIRLGEGFADIDVDDQGILEAGAASTTSAVLAKCVRTGLSGLEFLAGIPGTTGGAVRMNAGTGKEDIAGVIVELKVFADGRALWIGRDKMEFSYRDLSLRTGTIILGARFRMNEDTPEAIRTRIDELRKMRRRTQPTGESSAGCWFRNPEGDSAGRLIDRAGLKGMVVGGAKVSQVHANFLINTGGAKAQDFLRLAEDIREAVNEVFGVRLEEEVHVFEE